MSRKYEGEIIEVIVRGTNPPIEEDSDYEEEDEEVDKPLLYLTVSVSKKRGPSLEFCCTSVPDEITIDSLTVKNPEDPGEEMAYEGPDFL